MVIQLTLVRHGETDWNIDRRLQGWSDIGLNRTGREQAARLGEMLRGEGFDSVLSSDLSRAVDTARIAGFEPEPTRDLREMDFGDLEGIRWDDLEADVREALVAFEGFRAPHGESTRTFAARVSRALDRLAAGHHLIVAHGGVLRYARRVCGEDGFPAFLEVVRLDWSHKTVRGGPAA